MRTYTILPTKKNWTTGQSPWIKHLISIHAVLQVVHLFVFVTENLKNLTIIAIADIIIIIVIFIK